MQIIPYKPELEDNIVQCIKCKKFIHAQDANAFEIEEDPEQGVLFSCKECGNPKTEAV